jgi:hypothetical protein
VTVRVTPAAPRRVRPAGVVLLVLSAVLVAACGAAGESPAPSVGPSVAPATTAPSGGVVPPGPEPTSWPGTIVEAVMILGKADAEIQAAGADLGAAVAYEDLEAMWGAADGLVTLLERLQTQVPRIADYPVTAAAADAYEAAFPDMLAGATRIRDSITAGDAAGLAEGSRQLAAGLGRYAEARRLIGPLVDEAILMQRLLVK